MLQIVLRNGKDTAERGGTQAGRDPEGQEGSRKSKQFFKWVPIPGKEDEEDSFSTINATEREGCRHTEKTHHIRSSWWQKDAIRSSMRESGPPERGWFLAHPEIRTGKPV